VGNQTFDQVPFHLTDRIFKSQASPSPHNNHAASILLGVDLSHAYRVHLLLNTGNGFDRFHGRIIGQVLAYCDGTRISVADLQLGKNVREWQVADGIVSSAPRTQEVWSGVRADLPNIKGQIDVLTLDLPDACRSGRLTNLEIVDSSASTVNSLDPALNLAAVTVEYYR
jgi:hypothetical protein